MFGGLHVGERIAGNRHDVGGFARRQGADLIGEPEQIGAVRRTRHQGLLRRQAVLGHQREFARVQAMRFDAGIRAHGDRHADFHRVLEHLLHLRRRGARLHCNGRRKGVEALADPGAGEQRRHQVHMLLLHFRQRVVLQKAAVLDRVDPGGDGHLGGAVAVAVRRDLAAPVVRLGDDGIHFFLGQLRIVHRIRQRQHAARGHELDHVGAELDLIAHGGAAFFGTVAHALHAGPPRRCAAAAPGS